MQPNDSVASPVHRQPHPGAARASRWALGSLLCWFSSPVALYLGLKAKREIDSSPAHYSNACSAMLAIVLGGLGSALLVVSIVLALFQETPPPAEVAATTIAEPEATTATPPEPQAREPEPPQVEEPPAPPSDEALAIEVEYHKLFGRNPTGDHYATIARRRSMTKEAVVEEISKVGEYRSYLESKTKDALAGVSIVGDLQTKSLSRTKLGAYTVSVSLTAIRCPDWRPQLDKKLRFLFKDGLKKIVVALPPEVDALEAALWYRGLSCDQSSAGYGATWTRAKNVIDIW